MMWRYLMIAAAVLTLSACSSASKTGKTPPVKESCDVIDVNMEQGTIKGLPLTADPSKVKTKLPCETGESTTERGPKLAFDEHGFAFYPDADVLVLFDNFRGRPSQPGISLGDVEVVNYYGTPDRQDQLNGIPFQAFNRNFGSIVLLFNDRNKVEQVELHTTPAATVVPIGF